MGPIVRYRGLWAATACAAVLQSLPLSCHFRGCKAPLFKVVSGAISSELAFYLSPAYETAQNIYSKRFSSSVVDRAWKDTPHWLEKETKMFNEYIAEKTVQIRDIFDITARDSDSTEVKKRKDRMFTKIEHKLRRIMEKRHYVSISVSNAFLAVDFVILNRMTSSVVCHILCIHLRHINLVVQKLSHCM